MTEDSAVKEKKQPKAKAATGQLIHHVIRTISKDNSGTGGSWTTAMIEDYLSQYTNNGWKLHNTYFLEVLPEGYTMLWILVKD